MKRKRRLAESRVTKRSIRLGAHNTSIGLEDAFWLSLKEIAAQQGTPISQLVARIDTDREHANLYRHSGSTFWITIDGSRISRAERESEAMTRGSALKADEYRQLAAEEAELAKEATSNEARAQHYAMADYYTLGEAQERSER